MLSTIGRRSARRWIGSLLDSHASSSSQMITDQMSVAAYGSSLYPLHTYNRTVSMQQTRGIRLLEIFSKEKREQQRQKLKDEMQRGYFDDFRDFRDKNGKIFLAPEKLIPIDKAHQFPSINVITSNSQSSISFPPSSDNTTITTTRKKASLVCIAYRAGAQDMIEAWAIPFSQAFASNNSNNDNFDNTNTITNTSNTTNSVGLYELALIESPIMSLWPFRSMLISNGGKNQDKYALPAEYLYYFNSDTDALRKALYMTNRLTGYVYLLDEEGRVRWRGSGYPGSNEMKSLITCCHELIHNNN